MENKNFTGFRTADGHGSIYAFNEQGYTVRYNLSGHSSHGKIEEPCKCLFLTEAQADIVHEHLKNQNSKIRILYLDKETRHFHVWQGDDAKMPASGFAGIGIFDSNTEKPIDSWPVSPVPQIGMSPFEMRYFHDEENNLKSLRHLGHPVYEIYQDQSELDNALILSGFKSKPRKPFAFSLP